MINILEFYRNIPRKKCKKCGNEIVEKADCYQNICDHCSHPAI
ncbi:protein YhfH [Gracilibacillus boraciitolerans]|nr:protein YhfH [Gracilibacillus boraciitolerans]